MPNILRDFFILEFAIYNFGNVAKQFRWIANGLAHIDNEFDAIESRLKRIQQLNKQVQELEKVISGFSVAKPVEDTGQILQQNLALIDQTKYQIAQLSQSIRGFVPKGIKLPSPKTAEEALEQVEEIRDVLKNFVRSLNRPRLLERADEATLRNIEKAKTQIEELRRRLIRVKNSLTGIFEEVEMPEEFYNVQKQLESVKDELIQNVVELNHFNLSAYTTEQIFSRISALAVTKFGVLSLVLKAMLDNFIRLQRIAIDFQDALGVTETTAFALAKTFETIDISGSQLATSIANFQKRFFSDLKLPMLLMRFGVEPMKIFSGNILDFINEIVKVSEVLKSVPTFHRAFLLEVLGKDLIDTIRVISKYDVKGIIEDYKKVFSADLITRTRMILLNLQLSVSQFWVIVSPFVYNFTLVINKIVSTLTKFMEMVEKSPILRFVMQILTFVTAFTSLYLSLIFMVRTFVNAYVVFTNVLMTMKFLFLQNAIVAKIFNKSMADTASIMGVANILTTGFGVGKLLAGGLAGSLLMILGITSAMTLFGGKKQLDAIEDNTAKIAYNTSLTNMYLYNLTYDIRNLIRTTALGGTMPPLYQIINMQTALYYSLTTNSSVL